MMSDSETEQVVEPFDATPQERQGLLEALDELNVPDEYPEVSGDCLVTLQVRIPDVIGDPAIAVDRAMLDFMQTGMGQYVWMVTDMTTETTWAVRGGEVITPEEMEALLAKEEVHDSGE